MGLIRLLLAISVIALHIGPVLGLTFAGGTIAVQVFYIISGFYMCMVLSTKYNNIILFYTNRLLKLYPIYFISLLCYVLIASISLFFLNNGVLLERFSNFQSLDAIGKSLVVFTNLSIWGQDLLFILGFNIETHSWFFEKDYIQSANPMHHYLIITQAWTISLELSFYFLVPFLNKFSSRTLVLIVLSSLFLRFYTYSEGFNDKPWDYQFFPFELALFIGGMLSYRMLNSNLNTFETKWLQKAVFVGVILFIFTYQFIPHLELVKWLFYFVFVFALPFIFLFTKSNKLDRKIGELSYPVYMIHILVAIIVVNINKIKFIDGLIVTIVTIACAVIVNYFVQRPIENYRVRRIKK